MPAEDRDDKDRLQSLIAEILDTENRGEAVDRDSLLADHPEHADSLRDFFASHDQMKSASDVDPPTLPPRSSEPASEDPIIAPGSTPRDDPTLPPNRSEGDDPTLPPTEGASKTDEPTVGDKVRYFGDYELLEEIARGGMGVVYKARQMNLNRTVALKMILAGQFAGEEDVQRFYTEAEAAAALDHPGIVPIFEIGEHAGQHYFSMGYIEGQSLAQKVADGPLRPREAAELVKKICEAMAYAHERGVIHRDLKPANILIDASSGQPKVTDFGLAKKTEADSNLTGTGQILGTPAYMPPEQASGKSDVGPLADVYSIGAILYCVLTGHPPFQAASPMDTLLQVLDQEPVSLRVLNSQVPKDLETICHKCLRKAVNRRYQSANEVHDELARYLANEPIKARPVSTLERTAKWVKRRPAVAGMGCAMGLVTVVAFCAVLWQWLDAVRARERQEFALYVNRIALANREIDAGNNAVALEVLEACSEDQRDWEWQYLRRKCDRFGRFDFQYEISAVEFTPDGKSCVVLGKGGELALCDLANATIEWLEEIPLAGNGILATDGSRVAAKTSDGALAVYDVASTKNVLQVRDQRYTSLAFSPQGNRIASGSSRNIGVWDLTNGQQALSVDCKFNRSPAMTFSPDGSHFAAAADGKIGVWDASTGTQSHVIELTERFSGIRNVVLSPDEKLLATVELIPPEIGHTVRLWQIETGSHHRIFKGDDVRSISDIEFSANGVWLAMIDVMEATVWDVSSRTKVMSIPLDLSLGYSPGASGWGSQEKKAIAFSADCRLMALAHRNVVEVWRLPTRGPIVRYREPTRKRIANIPSRVKFDADGASVTWPGGEEVDSLDAVSGQEVSGSGEPLPPSGKGVISPNGESVLVASGSGSVLLLNSKSRKMIKEFSGTLLRCAFSPDGSLVASGKGVWDVRKREMTFEHDPPLKNAPLAFSPDSKLIAYGGRDSINVFVINFFESRGGAHVKRIVVGGKVSGLAFSPNGQRLLVGTEDNNELNYLDLVDFETGEKVLRLSERTRASHIDVVFDPSRKRIASAMAGIAGDQFRIWDAQWPPEDGRSEILGWHWREMQTHGIAERWYPYLFHLDRLIEIDPDNATYYALRGQQHEKLMTSDRALSDYRMAVALDRDDVDSWVRLAKLCAALERWDEAIEAWSSVIEHEPQAAYYKRRAEIQASLGQWKLAMADYGMVIELDPSSQDRLTNLSSYALLQLACGETDGNVATCDMLLKLYSEDAKRGMKNTVVWTNVRSRNAARDFDSLVDVAREIEELDLPINGVPGPVTLGAALYRAGRFEEAIKQLEAAQSKYNWLPTQALYFLAMAHHRVNNPKTARQWLQKANEEFEQRSQPWRRRLELELLMREAESLMGDE